MIRRPNLLRTKIKLLNVRELAMTLRLSVRTIYRYLQHGKIKYAIKIGGSWRFPVDDVEKNMRQKDG